MAREDNELKSGKKLRLGEILLKWGVINRQQLDQILEIQKVSKKHLGEVLIQEGLINERTLAEAFAQEFHLPFVDLSKEKIDKNVVNLFPPQILKRYQAFPFKKKEDYILVAISDPLSILPLQELENFSGHPTKPAVASKKQIETYINKYSGPMYDATVAIKEIVAKKKDEVSYMEEMSLKDLESAVWDAPVIKLVNSIIAEAIKQGASDVHFEPQEKDLLIRFRIDGVLYERMNIPKDLQASVISRIKIISGIDIAERRKPQDGRMSVTSEGDREFDVRVSTLPGIFGEKAVLRLLEAKSILIPLESLGLDKDGLNLINRMIYQPYGMILVTGPTGSGKTTTLYSILNTINDASRNIITVEDPIEYKLARINQTSINVRAGYTFATAIRHILRQDPDIIMVGEIRDLETAEIAIQAALTGHLVLSTLHTNNAPGAITRLLDMNIEPFLITSAVIGVIAQRLVRKLCPSCKKEYAASPELLKEISDLVGSTTEQLTFAKFSGCEKCNDIGYLRRTGLFEILTMNDEIKDAVLKKAHETEISRLAISKGMKTLRQAGIKRAQDKVTSLEEVMRVVFVSEI